MKRDETVHKLKQWKKNLCSDSGNTFTESEFVNVFFWCQTFFWCFIVVVIKREQKCAYDRGDKMIRETT
jgi:hypothetical protein